ncbi:tripartite motif-containing protein 3-like [Anneissia japonica]|uniref:tripartite motif-containing protein 3-like n=1 Tax=Anneissia japonica TaxID=1529436 RepID=UPI001425799D|nr:tripartite motif-containing protein 3-like [Anneissia japonica]
MTDIIKAHLIATIQSHLLDKPGKTHFCCTTEHIPEKFKDYFKMAESELSQFLENIDEKVLECTICFKRLKNPKSLNCLHSFCLACLEDWVKTKGQLICPTCSKLYFIPEGGLQKLPPNTFINNLLEAIEQFSKDQMKCICAKEQAKYYCQECRHYLCSPCSDHHQKFPMLANHKLHSVEDVQSMTPLQITSLQPPLCSLHNEPLQFFCCICNIPICTDCTITDHKEWDGKHKLISISEAFKTFKETSEKLEKAANDCKNKLQDGLKAVILNATKLQQSKDTSLRDIDNHVQEMVKKVKENGDKMKNKIETIYKDKKKVLDVQMDDLKKTISDINTKLSFLNQLLKIDEATAMQSSERVITALKERINELPTEPNDNGHIHFYINQQQIASLQCDIGYVSHMRAAECLTLKGVESVTKGQTIVVKVIQPDEFKIHANQLKATWTQPTGETNITQIQEDDNGDYFVTGTCTSPGICKLDVHADGEPIKQSPMITKVEKEGLVNTININQEYVRDVVKCEDDCLLVSCETNEILKYKQSGEYIGKIILPPDVQVYRMYKMKNGNIVFSDLGYNSIKICNMNGQVIKSIGYGVLQRPFGIHVDETSNVVYAAYVCSNCVFMFDIDSGQMMKKIGSPGGNDGELGAVTDVTLTYQRHILISDNDYGRLQLFDNEGRFLKVLVEAGDEDGKLIDPRGVVVDEDDNIIISSNHKLQLFSSDGKFIKRIDKPEDGINNPRGLCIISYNPRTVAVANNGNKSVDIFNY